MIRFTDTLYTCTLIIIVKSVKNTDFRENVKSGVCTSSFRFGTAIALHVIIFALSKGDSRV